MRRACWRLTPVLLFASQLALSADQLGSISGTVFRVSGSPAPLAKLTLIHQESGLRLELTASPVGKYLAENLPAGSYTVSARSHGADETARLNLVVHDGERVKLLIPLSTGWAPLESKELREFPLNGRNYLDLVRSVSNITPGEQGGDIEGYGPYAPRGNESFNSNGQRGQNNNFIIDGMDNNESWRLGAILQPSIEAIEQVNLVTTYIPSDLGHTAAAVVSIQTRSGQNDFHGSVYDYLENSALDARNFFDGPGKPGLVGNQFGGSFSSPIRRNNWFFFGDLEMLRQRRGLTVISTVPTATEKEGDFGATPIYDPLSISESSPGVFVRQQFPGNQIPLSRISPAARNLISLYPDPNLAGNVNNYLFTPALINNTNRFDVRSDKILGTRSTLFVRFSYESGNQLSPGSMPASFGTQLPAGSFAGSDSSQSANDAKTRQTAWGGVISHTLTLRPNLINELRAGISRFDLNASPEDGAVNASALLGIPGLTAGWLPNVSPTGYAEMGASEAVPFDIGTTNFQVEDNMLWTRRRHAWKFGFQVIRRHANGFASQWSDRGLFSFTPDYTSQPGVPGTGNSIASLLLGYPSEEQRQIQYAPFHLRGWEWSGFAQDEIRIGQRLTIEAGLRYSFYPPVSEADNRMVNFNFGRYAPALDEFAGQGGVNQYAGRNSNKLAFGPRVGFAINLLGDGTTVLRGSFSTVYDPGAYVAQGILAQNPPFASRQDIFNGSLLVGPNLADGLPSPAQVALLTPAILNSVGGAIYAVERKSWSPYVDEWGLSLQQRLRPGLLIEIGGTGSMGMHLLDMFNTNQPDPGPSVLVARRWLWYAPNLSRLDLLTFAGGSTYYGGEVKLTKQSSSSLLLQAAYTYAKAVDDSTEPFSDQQSRPDGPQDTSYLRGIRSASPFDITQRLVVTAFYTLPFKDGKGRACAGSRLLCRAIANWQASTMVTVQSGFPITPVLATNGLNNGSFQLPNRVGDGNLPSGRRSYLHWFNTNLDPSDPDHAFETPPLYQYGNAGYDIIRGPGLATADAALDRRFSLSEKLRLRARVEVFNLFNRANFALPNRILGVESSGVISHTVTPPRQIQSALRMEW